MKKINLFIVGILALMMTMVPVTSLASSLNINMDAGGSPKAGEAFTVNVEFKATDIDKVIGQITYDTDIMSYVSGGNSEGDGGVIYLNRASDNGKNITYKLKFKALKEGDCMMIADVSEAYNLDGKSLGSGTKNCNITVKAGASDSANDQNASSDNNGDTSEDKNKDKNKDGDKDSSESNTDKDKTDQDASAGDNSQQDTDGQVTEDMNQGSDNNDNQSGSLTYNKGLLTIIGITAIILIIVIIITVASRRRRR